MHPRACCRAACAALFAVMLLPPGLAAQSLTGAELPAAGRLSWRAGALAVGTLGAVMLLDGAVARTVRSGSVEQELGGVASTFRHGGQPEVWATMSLGLTAAGLVTGNERLTGAGIRATAAVALGGLASHGLKAAIGRSRPGGIDPDEFSPFAGEASMPSGHTTVAFALATSLADEIRRPWASVLLYGAATGTALSRVYDRRHWASDVAIGAAVGITAAKFVNGRWRVFGLRAPDFLIMAGGAGAGWSIEF